MSENLQTPLRGRHLALGAKMAPFGGWEMPIQYAEGILAEHTHTRSKAGIFDICHMGEFRVKGPNASVELDKIFARAVADQKIGVCRYNFLLTERGGVLDDLILYRMGENEFFIVVNAATKDDDFATIKSRLPKGFTIDDESAATGKIDLQGPGSADVLEKLGLDKAALPGYYKWTQTSLKGMPILLSRTGYTGELGFELYSKAEQVGDLWDLLFKVEGVKPIGLGARDTLRLEAGYPLYGHEMDRDTTPVEAGFGGMLKLEEPRTFVGSDALRGQAPKKNLVAIELDGRRSARAGFKLLDASGASIGQVTSGAFGPSLGKAIALAYAFAPAVLKEGDKVQVDAERAVLSGTVVALPFYKSGTVRMKI